MIKKALKIFTMVVFAIITFSFTNKQVNAYGVNIHRFNFGYSSGSYQKPTASARVGDSLIECDYSGGYGYNQQINLNAYDMEGRTIVPFSHISLSKFKAGTWIGINLRETKYASWNLSTSSHREVFVDRTCHMSLTESASSSNASLKAKYESDTTEYNNCVSKYTSCTSTYNNCVANKKKCQENYASCLSTKCADACKDASSDACEECSIAKCTNCTTTCTNNCKACGNAPTEPTYITCNNKTYTLEYYYAAENPATISDCAHLITDNCTPSAAVDTSYPKTIDTSNPTPESSSKISAVDYEAVIKTVNQGLNLLGPTLQFEIINPNDYNKEELKVLTFAAGSSSGYSKLLAKKDPVTVEGEPEQMYVSEDGNYEKTYKPAVTIQEYISHITKENYTNYMKKAYRATYEYGPKETCIDVKTGEVFYSTTECSKSSSSSRKLFTSATTTDRFLNAGNEDEIVNYWHYFIPLNTTTSYSDSKDLGFFIKISNKTGSSINGTDCMTILNNYPKTSDNKQPNYMDFITPVSKSGTTEIEFKGDHTEKDKASEDMKLFKEKGYSCRVSAKANFNIEQKFYGETKENKVTTIQGYGFYYRPINPNEPFPNNIASDSLWNGLYNSTNNTITVKNKSINLADSYNSITYTTQGISLNTIKSKIPINDNYTNWRNMNVDGSSQFIEELNLRKIVKKDLYKLGCGPDNLNWEGCN